MVMDEDGLGMSDDGEITIYGFIDRQGKVIVKFQPVHDFKELDEMRKMAEEKVKM